MKRPRIIRPKLKSNENNKTDFRTKRSLIKEENRINRKIKKLKSAIQKEQLKNNNKENTTSLNKDKSKLLKLKSDLVKIKKDIQQFEKEIKKEIAIKAESKKTLTKEAENNEINKTQSITVVKQLQNKSHTRVYFEADWETVFFENRKITIKHNNRWYDNFVPESKKFLNEIKHYCKFHNVPKLKVLIENERVKIQNEEVLFYHIDFLNITASNFGYLKLSNFNIDKWSKYNKQYYKSNLSFLLHTHTLKKLCEYSVQELPIIPVGEAVISSNGSSTIHNSFLFPIKSETGFLLIWESIEEGKASYVFYTKSYSNKSIQNIFNYIAGDTHNKRSTLLSSKDLQNNLNMKKRILHTDLNSWEMEIRQLVKKQLPTTTGITNSF